jgi:hypothetical protein
VKSTPRINLGARRSHFGTLKLPHGSPEYCKLSHHSKQMKTRWASGGLQAWPVFGSRSWWWLQWGVTFRLFGWSADRPVTGPRQSNNKSLSSYTKEKSLLLCCNNRKSYTTWALTCCRKYGCSTENHPEIDWLGKQTFSLMHKHLRLCTAKGHALHLGSPHKHNSHTTVKISQEMLRRIQMQMSRQTKKGPARTLRSNGTAKRVIVLQSLCDFFHPSGTLLDLSDWAFLSAGKGALRYSVPKWLYFP